MPRTEIDRSTDFLTTDQIVAGYSVVERETTMARKTGSFRITALVICHGEEVIAAPLLTPETAIKATVQAHQEGG